ncbi:MAG: tRNA (adenosine(37)-N6)-threonylcarbamoyltransferase complex dimerization subunit type 1 TsaB [Epulopiscium sp. Nuni2H_MBin003]|nr:MAG: tRNA (adenosine(37)-N6)-threonylcarbamoyltransferase complex dimerization subunit type 1 TsaB [Epulopiscium sp. Nuni2H_MBin003]
MNIIAIDSSSIAGSVSLIQDGLIIGEYYICDKLTHAETIMPMLENLKQMVDINTINAIAVTSGPGSFTGLRIGIATAKAMALAADVPIIGIPTLDVLAYNMITTDKLICPIMDARRNQVYTCIYKVENGELIRLTDYLAIDINELLQQVLQYNQDAIFVGDGIRIYKDNIKTTLKNRAHFVPPFFEMQRASVLAYMASLEYAKGNIQNADDFTPMYIRKPQAERELEENAHKASHNI